MRWLVGPAIAGAMLATGAGATVVYESATMGAAGQGGGTSLNDQLVGSRFTLTATRRITAIGGHLVHYTFDAGELFGAIVSLSGPTALPSGSPFDGSTMVSTVFTGVFPSADFREPVDVVLPPGDYALIFGAGGHFGATGQGAMASNNTDIPGASSDFHWSAGGLFWVDDGAGARRRFVVEDNCGNNVVEGPVEACDDGDAVGGDGCDSACAIEACWSCTGLPSACTPEPDGSPCASDGVFCNGTEQCDGVGLCAGGAAPCALLCDEGTDTCLSGCPPVALSGCTPANKSVFLARKKTPEDRDRMVWKWRRNDAGPVSDFGDPQVSTDYVLCVYTGTSQALATNGQFVIPAGNWASLGSRGWKLEVADSSGSSTDGLRGGWLKRGNKPTARIALKGRGTHLPDLSLPLADSADFPVTIQLVNSDSPLQCWESGFSSAHVRQNNAKTLRLKKAN